MKRALLYTLSLSLTLAPFATSSAQTSPAGAAAAADIELPEAAQNAVMNHAEVAALKKGLNGTTLNWTEIKSDFEHEVTTTDIEDFKDGDDDKSPLAIEKAKLRAEIWWKMVSEYNYDLMINAIIRADWSGFKLASLLPDATPEEIQAGAQEHGLFMVMSASTLLSLGAAKLLLKKQATGTYNALAHTLQSEAKVQAWVQNELTAAKTSYRQVSEEIAALTKTIGRDRVEEMKMLIQQLDEAEANVMQMNRTLKRTGLLRFLSEERRLQYHQMAARMEQEAVRRSLLRVTWADESRVAIGAADWIADAEVRLQTLWTHADNLYAQAGLQSGATAQVMNAEVVALQNRVNTLSEEINAAKRTTKNALNDLAKLQQKRSAIFIELRRQLEVHVFRDILAVLGIGKNITAPLGKGLAPQPKPGIMRRIVPGTFNFVKNLPIPVFKGIAIIAATAGMYYVFNADTGMIRFYISKDAETEFTASDLLNWLTNRKKELRKERADLDRKLAELP